MRSFLIFSGILFFLIFSGCSDSSDSNPVIPDSDSPQSADTTSASDDDQSELAGRYLWGYYIFEYDPDTNLVDVIPVRQTSGHWNVLYWLETLPCTNCVKVTSAVPTAWDSIDFTVEITHPFDSMKFSGFDVRGIAMFEAGKNFEDMYHQIPDASEGTGELLNPDSFTSLYAWWTTSFGGPDLQTYIKGKFASDTTPSASLNGFKTFVSMIAGNTRRLFMAGDTISQHFDIIMPADTFVFGYAVDANWAPPTVNPVIDPITDFPPEANCPEPFVVNIVVDPIGPGLHLGGGATELHITVYDGQPGTHDAPEICCPDLMLGIQTASLKKHYETYSTYTAVISNVYNPSPFEGEFKCLVRVRDELYGTTDAWIDLTAYNVVTVPVIDISHSGWAKTWGGNMLDGVSAIETDVNGNIYVGGYFTGTVDFDPGDGVDKYTSIYDSADAYLTRYDNQGNYIETMVWGGGGTDGVNGIAIDKNGDIICVGQWESGIDLDPDPDEQWLYSAAGNPESFISKFNLAGDFLWGQIIWGTGAEVAYDVDTDLSNNIYVTGTYEDNAAFEQDTLQCYPAVGVRDAFFAKYAPNSDLIWGKTMGSDGHDYGYDVATSGDDYVAFVGAFSKNDDGGPVDFNPSDTETAFRWSNGSLDAYVIRYNPSGDFAYGISFGDTGPDYALRLAVTPSHIYTCGLFNGEVDFDPGAGLDNHESNGYSDAWVTKFSSGFTHQWTGTWGGIENDEASDIALDPYGGVYIGGMFEQLCDFDPGDDYEFEFSNGATDAYLLKLNTSGNYQWVNTFGDSGTDRVTAVSVGEYAFPYVGGTYSDTVDFAPPSEPADEHTSKGVWDGFLIRYLMNGEW